MTRDHLIEEIRRARGPILPKEQLPQSPAQPPAATARVDDRVTLRNLLSELASRLDRTQEQLLARLGDAPDGPQRRNSGTPAERELYQEILSRLEPRSAGTDATEPRLLSIERSLDRLAEGLATQSPASGAAIPGFEAIDLRLATLEEALRSRAGITVGELEQHLGRLEAGRASAPVTPDGPGLAPAIAAVERRLLSIEERMGGDAGGAALGAAVSRLGAGLERLEQRLEQLSVPGQGRDADGGAPAGTALLSLEAKLDRLLAHLDDRESGEVAAKAVATLKHDFSLLVHTINSHLQESRQRDDQRECTLAVLRECLLPIAKHVGLDLRDAGPALAGSANLLGRLPSPAR